MREASGAPSPKHSRNASRRGMLLTPLGSRLRPAPARKTTGPPTCARSAAPLDRSSAFPLRRSCRRKAKRAHAGPRGAAATRWRSGVSQPAVGGIARELAMNRGRRATRFHERAPNRCRPMRPNSRTDLPRRWDVDAAGEAGLRRPKAPPGNRPPRHPEPDTDARASGPAPNRRTSGVAAGAQRLAAVASLRFASGRNGGCCRWPEPSGTLPADAFACWSKA